MKCFIRSEGGFTLLEVLTSMLIMSFSLLLLLHLGMIALDGNKWASGTTTCTQLLQEKLEHLRNMPNPVSGMDTVGEYMRRWTVATAGNHLRRVSITATWQAPNKVTESYTINTLMRTELP